MIVRDLRDTSKIVFADTFTSLERDDQQTGTPDLIIGTRGGYTIRLTVKECQSIASYTDNYTRVGVKVE